jgi:hypothetical protein
MVSELEVQREGHKQHTRNIDAYHHYASKFEQDGKAYYVRFSVQEMAADSTGKAQSLAHSSFVSEVSIYEQGAEPDSASLRVIDPDTGEPPVLAESGEGVTALDSKGAVIAKTACYR